VDHGFGVAAQTDGGYYGSGIYFTSNMSYASSYAERNPKGRVFLITLVTVGNPFPVTEDPFVEEDGVMVKNPESFHGQACRPGYQSHFVRVHSTGERRGKPVLEECDPKFTADEVVVFESSQALPLFLIFVRSPNQRGERAQSFFEDDKLRHSSFSSPLGSSLFHIKYSNHPPLIRKGSNHPP